VGIILCGQKILCWLKAKEKECLIYLMMTMTMITMNSYLLAILLKHHNQRECAGVGAETARGWRGDIVFRRGFWSNFLAGGGRIEVVICNRAGELDRTARSPASTTPQSTSVRGGGGGGGGWNGRGMEWHLRFCEGILVKFFSRGG
jgi:hypothetical protein